MDTLIYARSFPGAYSKCTLLSQCENRLTCSVELFSLTNKGSQLPNHGLPNDCAYKQQSISANREAGYSMEARQISSSCCL